MAVYPIAPGSPDYSGTFIPERWAMKVIANFHDATVVSQISNRDYEGEIKAAGDTVHIRTTPKPVIHNYVKNQKLASNSPNSDTIKLLIDKGEYHNNYIDDVDVAQMDIAVENKWTEECAQALKVKVDERVLTDIIPDIAAINKGKTAGRKSKAYDLGTTTDAEDLSASTDAAINLILDLGTVLDEANAPQTDRFLVIPPRMANYLKKSDLKQVDFSGDDVSMMRTGRLGTFDRFNLYVSHNLNTSSTGASAKTAIIAGHKYGLTFAMQLLKTEMVKSQDSFGTFFRGLQVYGYKVVKPEALAVAYVTG